MHRLPSRALASPSTPGPAWSALRRAGWQEIVAVIIADRLVLRQIEIHRKQVECGLPVPIRHASERRRSRGANQHQVDVELLQYLILAGGGELLVDRGRRGVRILARFIPAP